MAEVLLVRSKWSVCGSGDHDGRGTTGEGEREQDASAGAVATQGAGQRTTGLPAPVRARQATLEDARQAPDPG